MIQICSPNPCLNDGTCFSSSDSNPSLYMCLCEWIYSIGQICQTCESKYFSSDHLSDPCSPNPCLNDGTCFSSSDSNTLLIKGSLVIRVNSQIPY